MIGSDPEHARSIGRTLAAAAGLDALDDAARPLCGALVTTVFEPGFPGALVPTMRAGGDLAVYAVASSVIDWRRLAPLLTAFAGPTLTSFDGLPADLPAVDVVADIIRQTSPARTGVLRLAAEPHRRLSALRALERLRTTLARAPGLQRGMVEPTSWLLSRFQDFLNVGARDAAAGILERLTAELRVDALNRKFLEVQLLATFDEWAAVLALAGFESLCAARKPPSVTALLLEALYRVHLASRFEAGDRVGTIETYRGHVRTLALPMLGTPLPPSLDTGGRRIVALEAALDSATPPLVEAARTGSDVLGWLADELPQMRAQEPPAAPVGVIAGPAAPVDVAQAALISLEVSPALDRVAEFAAAFDRLTAEERARVAEVEPFRALLRDLPAHRTDAPPAGWSDWLARAADSDFTEALEIARQGMGEWPTERALDDPADVAALLAALERAQMDGRAADRAAQAIPYITGWLRRDPQFPRVGATSIYSSLLTLLALGPARGGAIYESSQVLAHALLAVGLSAKDYRGLLSDIEAVAGDGFGVDMIYWLLEIIEDLLRFGTPATEARDAFLNGALARVVPIYSRLSALQRGAIDRLQQELGWQHEGLRTSAATRDTFVDRLRRMKIALYSLTEASSKQAKDTLEKIEPTVVVDCAADHGGSPRLRALSENADLFVISWQSAKHAATDFIREHRGTRPLIYAQGRGFSSILRAIESHIRGS